jgi:hypothetical protein
MGPPFVCQLHGLEQRLASAAVHLNVKQIRELFAACCIEGKIEPAKACTLDQCLRLGILEHNDVPSSFNE